MTPYAYDTYVARDFSKITVCNLNPVGSQFPNNSTWLADFVGKNIFAPKIAVSKIPSVFMYLRRAESAVRNIDSASNELCNFVAGHKNMSSYFRILGFLTGAVTNCYQAMEFMRQVTGKPNFPKGDKTCRNARLCHLYNTFRHGDTLIVPSNNVQLDWIDNDGYYSEDGTQKWFVSFSELHEAVVEVAEIADFLV